MSTSDHITSALLEQSTQDTSQSDESWTPAYRRATEAAWQYEATHSPNSDNTDFTAQDLMDIRERGVVAWKFAGEGEVIIQDNTDIVFVGSGSNGVEGEVVCVQTNLPLPRVQEVYYFEVKLMDKPLTTNFGIGLATKPYPHWRFPGRNKHSVGYHTLTGHKYFNTPYSGKQYGMPCYEGDVVGVGYRPRTGSVFFTRNGVKLDVAYTGLKNMNLFPAVAADGPGQLEVNLGQAGFVLIEANVKKWGLAPVIETIAPPPAYGVEGETVLLASSVQSSSMPQQGIVRYKGRNGAPEVEVSLEMTPASPPTYDHATKRRNNSNNNNNSDDDEDDESASPLDDADYEALVEEHAQPERVPLLNQTR